MITTSSLIIVVVICVLLFLVFKTKMAKNKEPQRRSALEKILVSMFVSAKRDLDEAADQIRTPEISREECLQRVKKAIADLDQDVKKQMESILYHQKRMKEEILPRLKEKPGQSEGKARINKKKMEDALKDGNQDLANIYKNNAIMFLDLKKKGLERIQKVEKQIKETESVQAMALATYESRKATLEDIQMELEAFTAANISTVRFTESMNIINSLRRETADKLRQQNAAIEADNLMGNGSIGDPHSTVANPSEYEDELRDL